MGNIIGIQVGQCGNQIGNEFWDRIYTEHGISATGAIEKHVENDRKDVLMYESCDGRYYPRSILVDLEPRVVSSITAQKPGVYARENIFVGSEGGGAGNVWSSGYQRGKEYSEEILEIVQREAESSDYLDGFIIFHSVGGGTGSGMGSYILEQIKEQMPKKLVQSISIFPNNEEASDSVVQPYNTVLTLRRLRECADSAIVMDNSALTRSVGDALKVSLTSFAHINRLASLVSSTSTYTMRFPGSRFSDMSSIVSIAAPIPGCHFLVPAYAPFADAGSTNMRKTNCIDVQRRLMMPKTQLVNYEESESNCTVAAVNFMIGPEPSEVEKGMYRLKQRGSMRFAPWAPNAIHVSVSKSTDSSVSGLLLSNTTGFSRALQRIAMQYDRLKARNAFLDMYKREGQEYIAEFEPARECMQSVIDEYKRAELSDYIDTQ